MSIPVCFLRSGRTASDALFELAADDVEIVRRRRGALAVRAAAAADARAVALREWRTASRAAVRNAMLAQLRDYLDAHPRAAPPARARLKRLRKQLRAARDRAAAFDPDAGAVRLAYNRRRLLIEPVATRLVEKAERRALKLAATLGIDPEAPIVTVHARERGYKLGREMQDKTDAWDDSARNARIETHFAAVDFLVDRGYTVVRIGDPTMTPVSRRGVVDLATSPARDPLLELWCLFRSRFLICGESGPLSVSYLTNTPLLTVNATDPIGAFPVRADGVYLLKPVFDRTTGAPLLLDERLSLDRLAVLRDPTRHRFEENGPEEIVAAVAEMLDLLDQGTPESPGQARYRELVTAVAVGATHLQYVRKHGPDRGYLGLGRLARTLADPWYEGTAGEVAAVAALDRGSAR